jgi:hypothetical protein
VGAVEETQGAAVKYPVIGDTDLKVAKLYNMLSPLKKPTRKMAAPPLYQCNRFARLFVTFRIKNQADDDLPDDHGSQF